MKVYKGRQKLSLEQAASYYKHAYKIGMEHGRYSEQERIINLVRQHSKESSNLHYEYWSALADVISLIKGEQK